MSELNKCGCGSTAELFEGSAGFSVECEEWDCNTGTLSNNWTKEKAIEIWNKANPKAQSEWVSVATPEDITFDGDVLCWDGCDYSIDYVETDVETGTCYMANGTEVEAYKLLTPPKGE